MSETNHDYVAAAKVIASEVLGYAWGSIRDESILPRGYPMFCWRQYGGRIFQGGKEDLIAIAKKIIDAAIGGGE